ncbi:hypothetical protein ACIPUP_18160 [Pectobacterium actinidiae]|uniref:Addiction module toxin RelE n=1 Tax=Pectobacterium actinidiae TaxID=1507808 RepID=A0ABW8GEC3_9GAMM|nr:hypothetical protein [Pectobacterium carotovorum]
MFSLEIFAYGSLWLSKQKYKVIITPSLKPAKGKSSVKAKLGFI